MDGEKPGQRELHVLARHTRGSRRQAAGDAVPRVAHAEWKGHSNRANPSGQLQASGPKRIRELLPVRTGGCWFRRSLSSRPLPA